MPATISHADRFAPDLGNNTASAAETRPGFAIDFLPKTHGKAARYVAVVPIFGEHRSDIFPALVPAFNTPHPPPFGRQAASK